MDHTTMTIVGAAAGFALGLLAALLSGRISGKAMEKGSTNAVMASVAVRMGLDLAVLVGIYLLRGVNPLPFEPTVIGAAMGLSLGGIFFALRLSRKLKEQEADKNERN